MPGFRHIFLPARNVSSASSLAPAGKGWVEMSDASAMRPVVLVVEDDLRFARILLDLTRKKGFKGLVATTGNPSFCPAWGVFSWTPVIVGVWGRSS